MRAFDESQDGDRPPPRRPDVATIRPPPRFDHVSASVFRKDYNDALRDPAVRLIELDFAAVEYVDSTALGCLLRLREQAQRSGRSINICNCCGQVMRVLERTHFQKLFNVSAADSERAIDRAAGIAEPEAGDG